MKEDDSVYMTATEAINRSNNPEVLKRGEELLEGMFAYQEVRQIIFASLISRVLEILKQHDLVDTIKGKDND